VATKKKTRKKAAKKTKRSSAAGRKAARKPRKKASQRVKPAQKPAVKRAGRKSAGSRIAARAKTAKKKTSPSAKKAPARAASSPRRSASRASGVPLRERPSRPEYVETDDEQPGLGYGSAGQSGDIQGLSTREIDDSESVDELVEEGQGWEAAAVMGVEEGDSPNEVHTHEVPEDDVPEEYLNDGETDADTER